MYTLAVGNLCNTSYQILLYREGDDIKPYPATTYSARMLQVDTTACIDSKVNIHFRDYDRFF